MLRVPMTRLIAMGVAVAAAVTALVALVIFLSGR